MNAQHSQDITKIPPPRVPPKDEGIPPDATYVYFDLETTGLARNSHIIQIAAVCKDTQWNCFVTPKIPMSSKASHITGITLNDGQLFLRGKPVDSMNITSALDQFILFLSQQGKCIYLFGHNIKGFDCHVLLNALEAVGMIEKFQNCISGFLDTMLLCKSQSPGLSSYSQQFLVKTFLKCEYLTHDALQDVIYLQKLINTLNCREDSRIKASFSLASAIYNQNSLKITATCLPTLQCLVRDKVISKYMSKKIAVSNLNYAALKLAFLRGEEKDIRQILSEECNGRPRVTKSSRIINAIVQHFKGLSSNEP